MAGYSLHIGLNRVDPDAYDGWDGALTGCVSDAESMSRLAEAEGFVASRLIDDQATSQAVVGEIALLAQQASPGDICLISYSGHGGQVDDSNGDEPDLKDETWVLFDRQLIDDELYQMWSQFAAGVRVLVVSDSCHSGTVVRQQRSLELRRAAPSPAASQGYVTSTPAAARPRSMPLATQTADNNRRRGTYQFVQALSGAKSDNGVVAAIILISGCQDNQLSYDGDVNGQFTAAVLRTWANGAFAGTYRSFHSAILGQMPSDQTPNLYTAGATDDAFMAQRPFTINGAPTPSGPTTSRRTVRQGDRGGEVVYLQNRLTAHGYPVSADGVFGAGTTTAVRAFQNANGVYSDGVVGPTTWSLLDTEPAGGDGRTDGGAGGGTGTMTRPITRRGMAGEHVTYLQTRLTDHGYVVSLDGVFGPGTEMAVRSFQRSNGLTADGIVGPQVWAVLG